MANVLEMIIEAQDKASDKLENVSNKLVDLDKQAKKSTENFNKMASSFQKAGTIMMGIGTAIVGSIWKVTDEYTKAGDEVAKMAKRTGIAVETLSELRYAANLSGTSLSSIETAVKLMSQALYDGADATDEMNKKLEKMRIDGEKKIAQMKKDGATTEDLAEAQDALKEALAETADTIPATIRAFDKLGLDLKKIQKMEPEEQFFTIANAIAEIKDPTLKAALALDIFGRSGTELLPMLEEGADGIEKLRQEARDLNLVFDTESAAAAEKFQDTQEKLKASLQGLGATIGEAVMPTITEFITKLTDIVSKIQAWAAEHPALFDALLKIGGVLAVGGALLLGLGTFAKLWIDINAAFVIAKGLIPTITALLGTTTTGLAGALGYVGLALAGIAGFAIAIKNMADNWSYWLELLKQTPWESLYYLIRYGVLLKSQTPGAIAHPTQKALDLINGLPGYANGGTVPGPIGQPVPIMAHGGEKFLGAHNQLAGNTINVNVGVLSGHQSAMRQLAREIKQVIGEDNRRGSLGTLGQLDVSYRNAP